MANPVTKIRNTAADYRKLDGRDKRRFWTDGHSEQCAVHPDGDLHHLHRHRQP